MLGCPSLELPHPWIMRNCVTILRAGLLRLDAYDITAFDLDHANEAVAHAAANAGPFKMTVIKP